ncbi:MAG: multiheme c-type cytochrome [Acidiferrobacterales bacterium]
MKRKHVIGGAVLLALAIFLGWRFVRPMNIFVVSEAFERPLSTAEIPFPMQTLRAEECAACHQEFYQEWSTTIHSQAWTDPYFQVDWRFDREQQICRNCHTPLDRQQPQRVLGFHDKEKWDPILAPNPDFDAELQRQGVTCAVCHVRDGKILGPYGSEDAPHPVTKLDNPNQVCARCHVVGGERWDTFFRFPPCGTVAEIRATAQGSDRNGEDEAGPWPVGGTGEITVPDTAALNCVECHMPLVERPIVVGGKVRRARRHVWRGGHDPAMVKSALELQLEEVSSSSPAKRRISLTLTNVGAAHYVPTGTPDRHLTVRLRLLDANGGVIKEEKHMVKRTILWRPFIIDLWDTRLPRGEPRTYTLEYATTRSLQPAAVEAVVRYYLVDEKRRRRIGYDRPESTSYEVFRRRIALSH